jgi:hypothetical protein
VAVLVSIDSSRPIVREVILEGLGLADRVAAVALDVLDQKIHALETLRPWGCLYEIRGLAQ